MLVPAKKRKRCPDLTDFGRAAKESRRSECGSTKPTRGGRRSVPKHASVDEMRGGWRRGGDMIGPLVDGDDHNTANNDDAKMDTVESPAGYQSDNVFCSHVSNQLSL